MKSSKQEKKGNIFDLNFDKLHKIVTFVFAVLAFVFSPSLNIGISSLALTSSGNLQSTAIMDSTQPKSGIFLKNTGLGPVFIKSVTIYDKHGDEVHNNAYEIAVKFREIGDKFTINPLLPNLWLDKGQEHWILESKRNTPQKSRMIRNFMYETNISICYCPLTGECKTKNIGLKELNSNSCSK